VAVIEEGDHVFLAAHVENQCRTHDQRTDPHHSRDNWNEKPVTGVSHQLFLLPPRRSGIAGPEISQRREHDRKSDRDRDDLQHGLAHNHHDAQNRIHDANLC